MFLLNKRIVDEPVANIQFPENLHKLVKGDVVLLKIAPTRIDCIIRLEEKYNRSTLLFYIDIGKEKASGECSVAYTKKEEGERYEKLILEFLGGFKRKEINIKTTVPKKRGRKPKTDLASTPVAAPKGRRGRKPKALANASGSK